MELSGDSRRSRRRVFSRLLLLLITGCGGGDGNGGAGPTGPTLAAPEVLTDSLPLALVGVPYDEALDAAGGDGEYTWTLAGGELPSGLSLSRSGVISGIPNRSGVAQFSVRVESADRSATKVLDIQASILFGGREAAFDTTNEAGLASIATASFGGGILDIAVADSLGDPVPGTAIAYNESGGRAALTALHPWDDLPPVILVGRPDSIAAGASRTSGPRPAPSPPDLVAAEGLPWRAAVPITFRSLEEHPSVGEGGEGLSALGQFYWQLGGRPGSCSTYREVAEVVESGQLSGSEPDRIVFSVGSSDSALASSPHFGAAVTTLQQVRALGAAEFTGHLIRFVSRVGAVDEDVAGDSYLRAWVDGADASIGGAPVRIAHVRVDPDDPLCGGRVPTDFRLRSESQIEAVGGTGHTIRVQAFHGPREIAVPGIDVAYRVSGGSLTPTGVRTGGATSLTTTTGEDGFATVDWRLPEGEGSWTLTATVDWAGFGYSLRESVQVEAVTVRPPIPPECVTGSTYYVDPEGGADGNDGLSPGEAWRTLGRANRHTFGPGQCLLFKQGSTSRGQLTLDHLDSGERGAPLIIDTYFGEEGAGVPPARLETDSRWGVEPASGVPWSRGAGGSGASPPGASCDGEALATIRQTSTVGGELTGHGVVLNSAQHVVLRHLHLVGPGIQNDRQESGARECVDHGGCGLLIYTDGSHGRRFGIQARCVVAEGWDRAGFQVASTSPSKVGYSDVRFEDCAARGNGKAGFASNGEFSDSATLYAHAELRITRSVAYRNPGRASDTTRHSGNGIMLSDVAGAWVVDSRAYENGGSSNWPGGGPVGIWAWDATNVTLENNWAFDNRSGLAGIDGGGFDFDGGVTQSVMRGNRSWGNDGPGFMIYHFPGARGETAYNEIRNNVSTDDARTNGGSLLLGGGTSRVHSNVFAGNTVEGVHGPGVALLGPLGRDNQFVGNHFVAVVGVPTLRSELDLSRDLVMFRQNAYPLRFSARWGGTSYSSLVSWQAATGQEPGG